MADNLGSAHSVSVRLAEAAELRTEASRADLDAREDRNLDLSTFEAWFDACVAGDQNAIALAERRFRPEFAVAFDAWRATNPDTNPAAPRGPTDMPEYRQPGLEQAAALNEEADAALACELPNCLACSDHTIWHCQW